MRDARSRPSQVDGRGPRRNRQLKRCLLTLAVLVVVADVIGSAFSARAHEARPPVARTLATEWAAQDPWPYGVDSGNNVQRIWWSTPPANFRLYAGTVSYYRFRNFVWSPWGARRVVGHGPVRVCDNTGCSRRYSGRLILKDRSPVGCGEAVSNRLYLKFRVINFPGYADRTFNSPTSEVC